MTDQLSTFRAQYDYDSGETDPLRMIGAFVVALVIYLGVPVVGYWAYRTIRAFLEDWKK
jgi:hypothetical protein